MRYPVFAVVRRHAVRSTQSNLGAHHAFAIALLCATIVSLGSVAFAL
jgi:hypothetical protein